jgi:hypothetical protein
MAGSNHLRLIFIRTSLLVPLDLPEANFLSSLYLVISIPKFEALLKDILYMGADVVLP